MDKRYYWLKLDKNFFKQHEIVIVEGMPNGKDYVLFYLKLLVESVGHDGQLRFSDTIPYDEEMLATLTRTNVDIVRSAVKVFTELHMMSILDNGTLYLHAVEAMTGSQSDTDGANRQRRFRERQKVQALQERYDIVTNRNESIELRVKSKELREKNKFTPPTYEEARDYYASKPYAFGFDAWWNYYTEAERPWTKGDGTPVKDWKRTMATWHSRESEKPVGEKSNRNNHKGREYSDEFLEGLYKKLE